MADLACSAVTVRGSFPEEDGAGMCLVAWGLILLPPCKFQTTDGSLPAGYHVKAVSSLSSRQCAQGKEEGPELA